ncbi:pyridoxal kinase [Ferrovibrio sp.]|uniref:pyridoxal kinase n=1 Tax=Ferrovibrio sp. TaxID=1917215 RepID=UPI001B6F0C60|nr:pyridoxal kinase [Ferrovibrio sp.]MBP7065920.1 pyridoxal kinase [Ferrovibrio sp.]
MTVLAIQSQVLHGHVGNSAASLPLLRQGFEVWAIPAAILAFHPGQLYPGQGGPAPVFTDPAAIDHWAGALATLPHWRALRGGLSGWLGTPAIAQAAGRAMIQAKAANPAFHWLCDPVLGDADTGLYVDPALVSYFNEYLLPHADSATPNRFELEHLTGRRITDLPSALAAADILRSKLNPAGPRIVVATSLDRQDGGRGMVEALAVNNDGAWLAAMPDLGAATPKGAGDLFAALFLARLLRGKNVKKATAFAMAGCYGVLKHAITNGSPDMLYAAAQDEMRNPSREPAIERVR